MGVTQRALPSTAAALGLAWRGLKFGDRLEQGEAEAGSQLEPAAVVQGGGGAGAGGSYR